MLNINMYIRAQNIETNPMVMSRFTPPELIQSLFFGRLLAEAVATG